VREVAALQGTAPFSIKLARSYETIQNEHVWGMRESGKGIPGTDGHCAGEVHTWIGSPVRYGRLRLDAFRLPNIPHVQYKRKKTWWTLIPSPSILIVAVKPGRIKFGRYFNVYFNKY
jgi:hypothetical protein